MAAIHPLTACRPPGPLTGQADVPSDEAISHQTLIVGALAIGRTQIYGLREGESVWRTVAAMRALGATVEKQDTAWHVTGRGVGGLVEPEQVLDMGDSETTAWLLAGLLASHDMHAVMTGDASLRRRPMHQITELLALCGAQFAGREGGCLPLSIQGAADAMPVRCRMPAAFIRAKSAVLLAGLNARGQTEIREPVATPDHTENMLRHFGATVSVEADDASRIVTLAGQPELRGREVMVPGDLSFATFPLVAALLIPGSAVTLAGIGLNPLRMELLTTLREMGADITMMAERTEAGEPVGDLLVQYCTLNAIDVSPIRAPAMIDDYPLLAVAAAFAHGTTRMGGAADLVVRGNNRLSQTAVMLQAAGVRVAIDGDDLLVHGTGRVPGGCMVESGMDHQLAMSALVMGQATDAPVVVSNAVCIDASLSGFVALLSGLGANIS